jgi:hypothetical protein
MRLEIKFYLAAFISILENTSATRLKRSGERVLLPQTFAKFKIGTVFIIDSNA